ncbi:MAG: DUF4402 domain-containing protein [Desulfobulbus sp.]|jgi:hypothetical protein
MLMLRSGRAAIAALALVLAAASLAGAGEAALVRALDFGSIGLSPVGDAIVIDAGKGAAQPVAGRSVVRGGGSGQINVFSADPVHVRITYPDRVELNCNGRTRYLVDMRSHSQYGQTGFDLLANETRTVQFGGRLVLPPGESSATCRGAVRIVVDFDY